MAWFQNNIFVQKKNCKVGSVLWNKYFFKIKALNGREQKG